MYRVVFNGELVDGKDMQQVKQNLAALHKVSVTKIEPLFLGNPVTIKKDRDWNVAVTVKSAYERAGAICIIEKEEKITAPLAIPKIVCPKCSFEQPKFSSCSVCGVIFKKIKQSSQTSCREKEKQSVKKKYIDESELPYKNEKPLLAVSAIFSAIFWLFLIIATVGTVFVWILLFFISYLFAQSGLIAYLKGTAVKVTPHQFPDIYKHLHECCEKLQISDMPETYMLQAGGLFNAFATRFLRRNEGAIKFYFGHELGHIRRKHLSWAPFLSPARLLPLIGAAYSRAREYTCDNYGFACCSSPHDAAIGLAALSAGRNRCKTLSIESYAAQAAESGGFWMSFHELIADYPWLVKRMASIASKAGITQVQIPRRHPFAWFLAMFMPRTGGMAGGGTSIFIGIAVAGIIAAIAVPNFIAYREKARQSSVHKELLKQNPAQEHRIN